MAGCKAVKSSKNCKYAYLIERVQAHLSMLDTIKMDAESSDSSFDTIDKLSGKAKKKLKILDDRLSRCKIKRGKKLNLALDDSLKRLKKLLSVSMEDHKNKRWVFLARYLESLADLKKSRFE